MVDAYNGRGIQQGSLSKCLAELGQEYLRVGATHCDCLRDGSHLIAFLLLGIRGVSLAHSFAAILDSGFLDTFDGVRRSFLEASYLQNEFRLKESKEKALRWLKSEKGTWKADFDKWEKAILTPGPKLFGREYGDFSEIAHPTFVACQNSGTVLLQLSGTHAQEKEFQVWLEQVRKDSANCLFRLTWITLANDERFITLPIDKSQLNACAEFHNK